MRGIAIYVDRAGRCAKFQLATPKHRVSQPMDQHSIGKTRINVQKVRGPKDNGLTRSKLCPNGISKDSHIYAKIKEVHHGLGLARGLLPINQRARGWARAFRRSK